MRKSKWIAFIYSMNSMYSIDAYWEVREEGMRFSTGEEDCRDRKGSGRIKKTG